MKEYTQREKLENILKIHLRYTFISVNSVSPDLHFQWHKVAGEERGPFSASLPQEASSFLGGTGLGSPFSHTCSVSGSFFKK